VTIPHRIHLSISQDGLVDWKVDCPNRQPSDGRHDCATIESGLPADCTCTCPTCAGGDHDGCTINDVEIPELDGPPCCYTRTTDSDGLYICGIEQHEGTDPPFARIRTTTETQWPAAGSPIWATVRWEDGEPVLHPCAPPDETTPPNPGFLVAWLERACTILETVRHPFMTEDPTVWSTNLRTLRTTLTLDPELAVWLAAAISVLDIDGHGGGGLDTPAREYWIANLRTLTELTKGNR
jgi:hypothetical protein